MNNSMLLITSNWGTSKTFKMIPIINECPYNECIFDVKTKVLAIISKQSKESLHMLPKLTDQGDVQRLKIGKKENGKDYAEERKLLETFYEYYIEDKSEIVDFINKFAENALIYNFQQYIDLETASSDEQEKEVSQNNIVTAL
jgi:hypothetical protein